MEASPEPNISKNEPTDGVEIKGRIMRQRQSWIQRQREVRVLSRLGLLLFSGLVIAAGFLFAARQHFAAVQYGYKTENLRGERERLLEEQEQLILKKEQASAPAKLEAAARRLGLRPLSAAQVGSRQLNDGGQPALAATRVNQSASTRRRK
jgi:cell division protein FtsL